MKSYLWAIITRLHPDCSLMCACADKKRYRETFSLWLLHMSTRNVSLLKHRWRLARQPQRKTTTAHVNLLMNTKNKPFQKQHQLGLEIEKWRLVAHLCRLIFLVMHEQIQLFDTWFPPLFMPSLDACMWSFPTEKYSHMIDFLWKTHVR